MLDSLFKCHLEAVTVYFPHVSWSVRGVDSGLSKLWIPNIIEHTPL